jgi:hypothetical protein
MGKVQELYGCILIAMMGAAPSYSKIAVPSTPCFFPLFKLTLHDKNDTLNCDESGHMIVTQILCAHNETQMPRACHRRHAYYLADVITTSSTTNLLIQVCLAT